MTCVIAQLEHLKKDLFNIPTNDIRSIIDEAIAEIKFLRLHAGAVTRGESHADLKRRVGPQVVEGET